MVAGGVYGEVVLSLFSLSSESDIVLYVAKR